MQALRNIYKVDNQRLVIELPPSFQHSEVEVIILPVSAEAPKAEPMFAREDKTERLSRLLSIGVWSDADIETVLDSQNFINQWKIIEF
jgi:hypothetical protein